ncbi:MAG: hypothetical protein IPP06_10290 [Saprospiraceae bacterium]|nr:hypothetical protein [Candidatus Vicinibacter affinis]MBP6522886.1 hypothetical protein [Saprospiraceae bacterium]MBK6572906.1 hypothetical protein [Candidatus Vicinibacter affinis]MBK6825069.1 hypothetical protein [Candidatus Vicinibacter affinis]MBK7798516.1 hypothetical protein [Candidatus Vicinibacter affinis]
MNECEEYLRSGHIKPLKNLNRFPSNVQTIEYDHIHAYNQVGFNRPQNSEIFGFTKSWNSPNYCVSSLPLEAKNRQYCTQKEKNRVINLNNGKINS